MQAAHRESAVSAPKMLAHGTDARLNARRCSRRPQTARLLHALFLLLLLRPVEACTGFYGGGYCSYNISDASRQDAKDPVVYGSDVDGCRSVPTSVSGGCNAWYAYSINTRRFSLCLPDGAEQAAGRGASKTGDGNCDQGDRMDPEHLACASLAGRLNARAGGFNWGTNSVRRHVSKVASAPHASANTGFPANL